MNRTATRKSLAGGALAFSLLTIGCHSTFVGPSVGNVVAGVDRRMGTGCAPHRFELPPGASLDHPITEDEAISIALWNNAAFQEALADLGIARGDLIQAGLLPNPEFVIYFQVTDKPYKYLFDFAIESLWLRPIRIKSAARESQRVSERLTQLGLDLIRDVRQAYADVLLAQERVQIASEGVDLRGKIAGFAGKRLKAGEISEQEEATAKIDSLQAVQDAARIEFDVGIARERLLNLLGLGFARPNLTLDPPNIPLEAPDDVDALAQEAAATRPDALAAAQAVAAAEARAKFAKLSWVRFLGIMDATSGVNGHEIGPALRFTIPVFNWNQGAVARAEAELEKARRNQATVSQQILLDVQRSWRQYKQAVTELSVLRSKVRPEVEGAIRRAQSGYQQGNAPIFIVLETTRQLLDNRLREAQLKTDVQKFRAELERSVGRKLDRPPAAPIASAAPAAATPVATPSPPPAATSATKVELPLSPLAGPVLRSRPASEAPQGASRP